MINSISLNSYWKFIIDEYNEGNNKNWYGQIPAGAENIWVPSCWNELREELFHYEGVAWYFKEFIISNIADIKRNTLFFNGVNYKCEIWLNGKFAGSHTGGFTPFEIDITGMIEYDKKNLIVIRVDSSKDKFTIPPAGVDWFNYGGIFRDVYLNGTGESWIDDVTVITKMDGEIKISLDTGNYYANEDFSIDITVNDNEKICEVYRFTKKIDAKISYFNFNIVDARLWSLEDAFLYDFVIKLKRNNKVQDIWEHRIGVREFLVKDRKVLLNGKPVMLRGYSKHEEYPMLGSTFSFDIVRKDYQICKQGNSNFLRLCHYPHHPKEYEIASESGFLVIAEVPNVNLTKEHFMQSDVRKNSVNQMKEMIKYYKNETCIAFWSLFIECSTDEEESIEFVTEYIKTVKDLDPTRLTIHASIKPVTDKTYNYFDVVGVNYWTGWYNGEKIEDGSRMLDEIAQRYPEKPFIMTSGGWEGIPGFHSYKAQTKWSEESQADYLEKLTEMYLSKDYIIGMIIWTFNDFRVMPWLLPEKDWFQGHWTIRPMEMNFKGVLDFYRRPKLAYYRLQETFKKWDNKLLPISIQGKMI